jgi:hypothetical protein
MAHDDETLRATLVRIEQMMAESLQKGAPFPQWLVELAAELRETLASRAVARETPKRMRADPAASLGAQAHLDNAALHALKG